MPEILPKRMTREQQLRYTGLQLRAHRMLANLTVQQLATKAGVSRQIIYHCEKAENSISLDNYKYICLALGLRNPPLL